MSALTNLKIDTWWKAVLIIGITACTGDAAFKINFIDRKHLFDLGIGMILVGLGFWKSYKVFSQFIPGGILSTRDYKHDIISVLLIIAGATLICLFGFLIIKSLI